MQKASLLCIVKRVWRIAWALLVILAFAIIALLIIVSHYTPSCNRAYVSAAVPVADADWDILTVDNSCSITTSIVAENRTSHERRELVDFISMETVHVLVKDGQIHIVIPSPEGISHHEDSLDNYRLIFDFTAKNSAIR